MDSIKFTGWVEQTFEPDQYSRDIVVSNYNGVAGKQTMMQDFKDKKSKDYPISLRLKAGIKSGAASQLDGVCVGDKVSVSFCVSGKSGISKKTGSYYCINELNICKKDGLVVLDKQTTSPQVAVQAEDFDVPF